MNLQLKVSFLLILKDLKTYKEECLILVVKLLNNKYSISYQKQTQLQPSNTLPLQKLIHRGWRVGLAVKSTHVLKLTTACNPALGTPMPFLASIGWFSHMHIPADCICPHMDTGIRYK